MRDWFPFDRVVAWLLSILARPGSSGKDPLASEQNAISSRARVVLVCVAIFSMALSVRLLHWQDTQREIMAGGGAINDLGRPYVLDAKRMVEQGGVLFPIRPVDRGDALMAIHPPGYPALFAWLYGDNASISNSVLIRSLQIGCDGLAAVLVALICSQFFPSSVGILAGSLVALSPHLAYHSLWLSPDTLVATPTLLGVYLVIRAIRRPRYLTIIAAGIALGLSCWLRANGMLLAPALALILWWIWRGRRTRWSYAAVLLGFAAAVVAPITIRNAIVFHQFIPVAIDAGGSMMEGIGDFDKDGRFGLPATDDGIGKLESRLYGNPEYDRSLWVPDGVKRDRARLSQSLAVVRRHPIWFLGVMIQRMGLMLRYNDNRPHDYLSATCLAPVILAKPPFVHSLVVADSTRPVWQGAAPDLIVNGTSPDPSATVVLADDKQGIKIKGGVSKYGDQFVSGSIAVTPNTDYLMRISLRLVQGDGAVEVKSADRRLALASTILGAEDKSAKRRARKKAEAEGIPNPTVDQVTTTVDLPFAAGAQTKVHLAFTNNGDGPQPLGVQAGSAEMYDLGPTRYQWTRYFRPSLRVVQKSLFQTWVMITSIVLGIIILAVARQRLALSMLLVVPVYYMVAQSALHTEYRYILPIHYFLFAFAAVAIYSGARAFGVLVSRFKRRTPSLV